MLPDMAGQVLAPSEAELTGRELCAEEPLTLLFLRRPLRLARHTFVVVVRPILVAIVVIVVSVSHLDIL